MSALRPAAPLAGLALLACGGGYGGGRPSGPPASMSLSIQPTTISLGSTAILTWDSSSGSSCTASGGWSGAQAGTGTRVVTPPSIGETTYALTCTTSSGGYGGGGGSMTTKTATLTVSAASAYTSTALLSDSGVGARGKDALLVNPWGLAFGPATPMWVANNATGTGTTYDGNGVAQPFSAPLRISFPVGPGNSAFAPTGVTYNPSATAFVVASDTRSATAAFLFVGENGMIGGWSSAADPANVIAAYTAADGAVYTGVAVAPQAGSTYLYATDFRNAKVDVFDADFIRQAPSAGRFSFADSTLPAGYAPFGILAISDGPSGLAELYVTYAQQALPDKRDHAIGAGLGIVNVFDASGTLLRHLILAGGPLDAPWGMALAPDDFGTLARALLVANTGDGRINAFDPVSGRLVGSLNDTANAGVAVPGLWGIAFGNDAHNQPHNTLFYSAGTNNGDSGSVGRIDVGATAPILGAPPVLAMVPIVGPVHGTVVVSATATDPLGITSVHFFANGARIGIVAEAPYSVTWDSTSVADGTATLNAKAIDPDGNVAVSPALTVTVANSPVVSTLAEIQTAVLTPICSGCHDGSTAPGGALPASLNLTAGNSFAGLVDVQSQEQPDVLRVKAADPAASYLIQKLEGAASIGGQRMPPGGLVLDQATIDRMKSWIAAGAISN